jgi:hypothetical protein
MKQRTGAKRPKPVELKPEPVKRECVGGPSDYGSFYFCVKTDLSENGEIYVMADEVQFIPSGGVLFIGRHCDGDEKDDRTNLALAPGHWTAVYAASCFDGHAVAVEHWKGEIQR